MYLATATSVLHFMGQSLSLETLATGFTRIAAIGTDRTPGGSHMVVVGDAGSGWFVLPTNVCTPHILTVAEINRLNTVA